VRLHPDKPYFVFTPSVLGAFEIKPGDEYVSRYRYVVHDGPPDAQLYDRIWTDYAEPFRGAPASGDLYAASSDRRLRPARCSSLNWR
jgi:hypothetical protein